MFKATLKSLLSRKLRLVLSGLAVVIGVMAVSGALVATDSIEGSFDALFQTANEDLDVQVSGAQDGGPEASRGLPVAEPIPAEVVDRVAATPGVREATGDVLVAGVRVVGPNGKVVVNRGAPRFGAAWHGEDGLVELREGRGPQAPDEVAINASLAGQGEFDVGNQIEVLARQSQRTFTVVGIFGYSGGRDSLAGETRVAFTEPVAQELLLGRRGVYSAINVEAGDGVSPSELRDEVQAAISSGYTVRTGQQVAEDQAAAPKEFLNIVRNILLGFSGVALFVGIFLILNTFSIIVAQRTRELALFRSLGASRGQVIQSVLVEAVLIGLIASTLGLIAGVGVAALLKTVIQAYSGVSLPFSELTVPVSAIAAAYLVGMLATVVAALLPALRASRVPPIAAMREAATPDKPLTALTIAGAISTFAGSAAVGTALLGDLGDNTPWALLGGVLPTFIGVAMLTPILTRPFVGTLGLMLSWPMPGKPGRRESDSNPRNAVILTAAVMTGISLDVDMLQALLGVVLLTFIVIGVAMLRSVLTRPFSRVLGLIRPWLAPIKLGRLNSARNPRRTAITAATLMIGMALVTGVSVVASSLKASIETTVNQDLGAVFLISGDRPTATYDPAVIDEAKQIPGVTQAVAVYSTAAQVGEDDTRVEAGDVGTIANIFGLKAEAGELRTLETGEIVVDDGFAKDRNLSVDDTVELTTQRGGPQTFTVVGIYQRSQLLSGPLLSVEDARASFRSPLQATQGFITIEKSANADALQERVEALLEDNPGVSVESQSDYVEQQASQVNTFVIMLYMLLGLAIVIAVLGIINTLALSILERTRELGLMRVVGMRRSQVIQMVTVESVVIAVFGALLGLVVGCALGIAVVRALEDQGIPVLSVPWGSMVVFLVLAVIVGLIAAIIPAVRASRINVLRAITYE